MDCVSGTGVHTVHMVHHLVRNAAVVLQQVVVRRTRSQRNLLGDGQDVAQRVIGQLVELGRVILGDDETVARRGRANVWVSTADVPRKAYALSGSMNLRDGILPAMILQKMQFSSVAILVAWKRARAVGRKMLVKGSATVGVGRQTVEHGPTSVQNLPRASPLGPRRHEAWPEWRRKCTSRRSCACLQRATQMRIQTLQNSESHCRHPTV